MIALTKGPIPNVLSANAAVWTATLVSRQNEGGEPTKAEKGRYNHVEIKAALLSETHGKCAYCESKLRHIAYGDIEHVVPKSTNLQLWFNWANLTIACDICNTNKGTREGLVDPYLVDPAQHLWIIGELILPAPGSDIGIITERVIDLNRLDLIERRRERLKRLLDLLGNIVRVQHAGAKAVLQSDFLREITDDKEYAALSREVYRSAQVKGLLP